MGKSKIGQLVKNKIRSVCNVAPESDTHVRVRTHLRLKCGRVVRLTFFIRLLSAGFDQLTVLLMPSCARAPPRKRHAKTKSCVDYHVHALLMRRWRMMIIYVQGALLQTWRTLLQMWRGLAVPE